jgi:hypothetical protein
MTVVAKSTRAVARPLKVLVPLIKEKLKAVENAGLQEKREAGALLIEVKESGQVALGSWGVWLNRNFHLSARTAQKYMQLVNIIDDRASRRGEAVRSVNEAVGDTARAREHREAWKPFFEATREVDVEAIAQEQQSRADEIKLHRELALELIDIGYKALAIRLHPDRGGSRGAMTRLNRVRDELKEIAANRRYL